MLLIFLWTRWEAENIICQKQEFSDLSIQMRLWWHQAVSNSCNPSAHHHGRILLTFRSQQQQQQQQQQQNGCRGRLWGEGVQCSGRRGDVARTGGPSGRTELQDIVMLIVEDTGEVWAGLPPQQCACGFLPTICLILYIPYLGHCASWPEQSQRHTTLKRYIQTVKTCQSHLQLPLLVACM